MLRVGYLAGVLALAVFYYYFFGAGPTPSEYVEDLEWWRPWGTFMHWPLLMDLAQAARAGFPAAWKALAVGGVPALAVAAAGWRILRTPLERACLVVLTLLMLIFVYYGLRAEQVWRFLEWRFVAVAAAFCAIVTAILLSASLFDSLLRGSRALAALVAVAAVAGIFLLSTEVTGTNSHIQFNISPWPVVTLFGFLLVGATIASLQMAVGAGTWLRARLTGALGVITGLVAAVLVAGAAGAFIFSAPGAVLPVAFLALLITAIGFALPEAGPETRGERRGVELALVGAALVGGIVTWLAGAPALGIVGIAELLALGVAIVFAFLNRRPAATTHAGSLRFGVGALILVAILGSAQVAASMQRHARDVTALQVLDALEAYKKDNATYPDSLDALVPKYLAAVPRPEIGLIRDEDDRFSYSNYGDSYALEFASVLWVQCQYSPPYEFAASDPNEAADAGEDVDSPYEKPKADKTPPVAAPKAPSEEDLALKATLAKHGLNGSWTCPKEPPKLW
jgi:hypothetical protein